MCTDDSPFMMQDCKKKAVFDRRKKNQARHVHQGHARKLLLEIVVLTEDGQDLVAVTSILAPSLLARTRNLPKSALRRYSDVGPTLEYHARVMETSLHLPPNMPSLSSTKNSQAVSQLIVKRLIAD